MDKLDRNYRCKYGHCYCAVVEYGPCLVKLDLPADKHEWSDDPAVENNPEPYDAGAEA